MDDIGTHLPCAVDKDPCIAVYTQQGFEKEGAVVRERARESKAGAKAMRFFFGNAYPVPKDNQGRMLIPQNLIEYAHLQKDIVVIGVGDWFEIWDKSVFDEQALLEDEGE